MPRPVGRGQRYMPGLDGLRAIAVLGRDRLSPGLQLGPRGAPRRRGLLHPERLPDHRPSVGPVGRAGRMRLGNFWLRRARRLLPALFVMLVVVMAWVTLARPRALAELRGSGLRGGRVLQQLVADLPTRLLLRPLRRRRPLWATCGRWRSRSSSTSCGPGCCSSACASSRSALPRPRSPAARRGDVDACGRLGPS